MIRENNRTEYFFPCLYKHLLCSVGLLSQNKWILSAPILSMTVLWLTWTLSLHSSMDFKRLLLIQRQGKIQDFCFDLFFCILITSNLAQSFQCWAAQSVQILKHSYIHRTFPKQKEKKQNQQISTNFHVQDNYFFLHILDDYLILVHLTQLHPGWCIH